VTAEAIAQIRGLITARTLLPGQKLPSEPVLSSLLGVSRPALREAIYALAAMGVLEKRQGSGTYVSSLSADLLAHPLAFVLDINRDALRDIMEVRLLLEVGAAESAAQLIDEAGLRHLHDILATLHDALDDPERFLAGDTAFHQVIHAAARNVILVTLMDNLSVWIKRIRMLTVGHADMRAACLREHEEIYQALHDHDPEAAGKAMRAHVEHVRDASLRDQ
jgi:DNA-binding FadR family transcriptional regulator